MEKRFPCNVLYAVATREKQISGAWENGENRGENGEKRRWQNYHLKKCRKIVAVAFCTHHWGPMECAHTDTKCRRVVPSMCVCAGGGVCVCWCVCVRMAIKQKVCKSSIRIVFDLYFVCELPIVRFFGGNVPRPLSKSKGFLSYTHTRTYTHTHSHGLINGNGNARMQLLLAAKSAKEKLAATFLRRQTSHINCKHSQAGHLKLLPLEANT